ncbi:sigma-54-dependent transcriptional regulator [Pelagerythrobacter sp.]|uniref:sigma-54-dependent transcriptional regulator n=1 Tax=Pelagerythrobacter sp. TaxID=2800702 RepID=UPI0035B3CDF0
MSNESPRPTPDILIVDDDADVVRAARLLLERRGCAVRVADGPEAAWVELARCRPDVVLLDLNFARGRTSGEEGLGFLDRLMASDPRAVVIVITGHSGIAIAVDAMRRGASDFLIKPWKNDRLAEMVERAVAQAHRAAAPPGEAAIPAMLGESTAIAHVRNLIARIAPTAASVLISGPPGSGKTFAANLIHRGSGEAQHPLVKLEGKLIDPAQEFPDFAGRTVLIENADQIPLAAQHGLIGALEGARVVATTRLGESRLREALTGDLLHRIGTIAIDLPPLADRGGDIALLAHHFMALSAARHGRAALPLTDEAVHALATHPWPDNVRGLQQAMERAVLLASGDVCDIEDLGLAVDSGSPQRHGEASDLNLERNEARLVLAALKRHSYNISRAAADLGLTRAALYRRMEKHDL